MGFSLGKAVKSVATGGLTDIASGDVTSLGTWGQGAAGGSKIFSSLGKFVTDNPVLVAGLTGMVFAGFGGSEETQQAPAKGPALDAYSDVKMSPGESISAFLLRGGTLGGLQRLQEMAANPVKPEGPDKKQLIGSVVGAGAGYYFGGPQGAAFGANVGGSLSELF